MLSVQSFRENLDEICIEIDIRKSQHGKLYMNSENISAVIFFN